MNYSQPNPSHASSVPSQSLPPQDWYTQTAPTSNFEAPLQEPVPFEDFQFTFDLGPDFAMPVPLDMPPMSDAPLLDDSQFQNFAAAAEAAVPTIPSPSPSSMQQQQQLQIPSQHHHHHQQPPPPPPHHHHHHHHHHPQQQQSTTVLNEDDQRAFSQFLDAFFMDQDMQVDPLPSHMSSLYDDHYPAQNMEQQHHRQQDDEEDEERRRSSILRSLDEQKRQHQRFMTVSNNKNTNHHHHSAESNAGGTSSSSSSSWTTTPSPSAAFRHDAVYLKKSETISFPRQQQSTPSHVPTIPTQQHSMSTSTTSSSSPYKRPSTDDHHEISMNKMAKKRTDGTGGGSGGGGGPTRARSRPQKELLTEAEKRANHIASEQKRRTTIRTGFKDLTEIVPTLKNINNSKSTVLFKAVDYIRYLEKRTKSLKDKVGTLEMRLQVEGRKEVILQDRSTSSSSSSMVIDSITPTATATMSRSTSSSNTNNSNNNNNNVNNGSSNNNNPPNHHHHHHHHLLQQQQQQHTNNNKNKDVAACAQDALEKHKEHLKSLMQFQEQLHFQQKLMAQHEFGGSPPRPTSRAFRPVHEESDARMMSYANSTTTTTTAAAATSSRTDTNNTTTTTATTSASTSKATVSA